MPGQAESGAALHRRWDDLRVRQSNFRNLWEDIDNFVIPFRRDSNALDESPGQRKSLNIFDSTAVQANIIAASAVQGVMAPPTIQWFSPTVENDELQENKEVEVWFEEVGDIMRRAFNDSNFTTEVNEAFIDLLGYGTSVMQVTERNTGGFEREFRGLRFKAFQPSLCAIAENEDGQPDTVFRLTEMNIDQLVAEFGIGNVSERVRDKWNGEKMDDRVQIVHATFPRDDVSMRNVSIFTPGERLPYASDWFELDSKHFMRKSGTFARQYAATRWYKGSQEEYGRSPGINSMPDIRSLNRTVQLELEQLGLVVRPPLLVLDRGVIGSIRMTPGGVNALRNRDALAPFEAGGRFDVVNLEKQGLQTQILRAYFIDQIQFPPMEGTPATATEIVTRFEMMQRILGPTFGRIQEEKLDTVLRRSFWLMARRGAFPRVPAVLDAFLSRRPGALKFAFEGPLAKAQKLVNVESIERAVALLAPLGQTFPEILDAFNAREAGRFVLEALNVPARVVASREEVAAKQAARAQETQLQAETEETLTTAEALGEVTPFLQLLNEAGVGAG